MLVILRLALYFQLLLGLGRMFGYVTHQGLWELHLGIGALIVVLAIGALRPIPRLTNPGPRAAARWFPLLPMAVGLAMYFGMIGGRPVVMLHALLGVITIGLVEVAAGRQRRASRSGLI